MPYEIKYYLKELDSNGGSDPENRFPLFLKKTVDLISPKFLLKYRPISITPIILKIFEKLIARRLY